MKHSVQLFCLILLSLVFPSSKLLAQDTLILIDRPSKLISSFRVEGEMVYFKKVGRNREKKIEIDKVFSVRSPGKPEQVVYVQDTLENNWYTAEQMSFYILGQQDARKGYRNQATKAGGGGVLFGFGGSAAGFPYSPLFVIAYTSWKGYQLPKFTQKNGYNPVYLSNEYYKEGFGTTAKRMVTRRSFAGSMAGFILGTVTLTLVLN